jgi:hypothetical protein
MIPYNVQDIVLEWFNQWYSPLCRRNYYLIYPMECQTYFDVHCPCGVVVPIEGKFLEFMSHFSTMVLTKDSNLHGFCDILPNSSKN